MKIKIGDFTGEVIHAEADVGNVRTLNRKVTQKILSYDLTIIWDGDADVEIRFKRVKPSAIRQIDVQDPKAETITPDTNAAHTHVVDIPKARANNLHTC